MLEKGSKIYSYIVCAGVILVAFVLSFFLQSSICPVMSEDVSAIENTYETQTLNNIEFYYSGMVEYCALYVDGVPAGIYEDENFALSDLDGHAREQMADTARRYGFDDNTEYIVENNVEYRFLVMLPEEVKDYEFVFPTLNVMLKQEYEETNSIPFSSLTVENSSMYEGEKKVSQTGKNGKKVEKKLKVYSSSGTYSESLISSSVIQQPVDEVTQKGIKKKSEAGGGVKIFIAPYAAGSISSEYGYRSYNGQTFHGGTDFAGKVAGQYVYGEPIRAAGDGTVVYADWMGTFGNLVIIEHSNGIRTYYAHQSKILVTVGQKVKQGEQIGKIGSTGDSEAPHCHFEVRLPDGKGGYYRVDPKDYIINYESYLRK